MPAELRAELLEEFGPPTKSKTSLSSYPKRADFAIYGKDLYQVPNNSWFRFEFASVTLLCSI